MARTRKTTTPEMKDADQKIAGMKAIEPALALDNGVSVAEGERLRGNVQAKIDEYNTMLAQLDGKLNEINAENKILRAFNKKVLPAVGLRYGTDSDEYEKAGGVRDSERKKPVRKKTGGET